MKFRLLVALALVARSASAAPEKDALIEGIPHVRESAPLRGEACAEMFLKKLGKDVTRDDVFAASGLDPALGRGCRADELATALAALGFEPGEPTTKLEKPEQADAEWGALRAALARGVPSIVVLRDGDDARFVLVTGHDARKDEVLVRDPGEDDARRLARGRFLELWTPGGVVTRLALSVKELVTPKRAPGFTPADYARHCHALRKKLPDGFTALIEPPFVVLGDGGRAAVKSSAEHTVRWAVAHLKKAYFDKDPAHIIDVWLFKDKTSYEKNTRALLGDTPTTPFGYYSPKHRALIMNIATGGGTLVHEIVHPFVHANFPACPSWLNEGLGSLYEQCHERGGHIVGLTNWRLAGLQKAIERGKVPSFEKLTGTSSDEFYNEDKGTNYAQARYLCYYLQEKGLLHKFYREFRGNHEKDPTGYKSLVKILGEDDMDDFKKRWEKFVAELTFP